MSELMSDERLAEIRKAAAQYRGSTIVRRKRNSAIAHRAELLVEMDRLRMERNGNAHLAADFLAERNEARAEAEQLRAREQQYRTWLNDLGYDALWVDARIAAAEQQPEHAGEYR